jgi:copper chaperone CopZ
MRFILAVMVCAELLAGCEGSERPAPQPEQQPAPAELKKEKPGGVEARPTTVALEIEGMHCDSCQQWVKDILEELDGVASAEVSYEKHSAVVTLKPGARFNEEKARSALEKDNYKLKPLAASPASQN